MIRLNGISAGILFLVLSAVASHAALQSAASSVTPPQLVRNELQYPLAAIAMGEDEGSAEVRFLVNESGEASEFIVTRASHEVFARAAKEGLAASTFFPALRDGEAVPANPVVKVHFRDRGIQHLNVLDKADQRTAYARGFKVEAFSLARPDELDGPLQLANGPSRYMPVDDSENPINGRVRMEYYIDRDGSTRLALPLGEAHPAVVEAALSSIRDMRYEPPKRRNIHVPVRVTQAFVFRTDG